MRLKHWNQVGTPCSDWCKNAHTPFLHCARRLSWIVLNVSSHPASNQPISLAVTICWRKSITTSPVFYKQTDFQLFLALVAWEGNISSTQWPAAVHVTEPLYKSANPTVNQSQCGKRTQGQRGVLPRSVRGQQRIKPSTSSTQKNRHKTSTQWKHQNNPGKKQQ